MFIFVSVQAACVVKEPGTLGEAPSGGGAHDGAALRSGSRRGPIPTPTGADWGDASTGFVLAASLAQPGAGTYWIKEERLIG